MCGLKKKPVYLFFKLLYPAETTLFVFADNSQRFSGQERADYGGTHVQGGRFRLRTWRYSVPCVREKKRRAVAYQMDGPRIALWQHIFRKVRRLELRGADLGGRDLGEHALSRAVRRWSYEEGKVMFYFTFDFCWYLKV